MKIHIDTTAKTIRLDEFVIMSDLITELEKLFPNGEWKEYQLIHDYSYPNWPPATPWITY